MVEVAALCSNCPIEKIVHQLTGVLPGTKVTAMQQVVKNRMSAMDRFRAFSYILAAMIVAIEALVVFVTMMGSVNARTREIGIFRALGFRRRHVTNLILLEAGLASLVAGALGYLAGMLRELRRCAAARRRRRLTLAWVPAVAGRRRVSLALTGCALASLYPALHASRLDPDRRAEGALSRETFRHRLREPAAPQGALGLPCRRPADRRRHRGRAPVADRVLTTRRRPTCRPTAPTSSWLRAATRWRSAMAACRWAGSLSGRAT